MVSFAVLFKVFATRLDGSAGSELVQEFIDHAKHAFPESNIEEDEEWIGLRQVRDHVESSCAGAKGWSRIL